MGPQRPDLKDASHHDYTAADLVFSCAVCHRSLREIYSNTSDDAALSDGREGPNRTVTRLWLTSCGHITCGKHLEGGGVPLHPQGSQPQAPCPVCIEMLDDHEKKTLHAIRGLNKDEHDTAIPHTWFQMPPIALDAKVPGMDALRFQFLSLVRNGVVNTKSLLQLRPLHDELSQKYHNLQREAEQARKVAVENETLRVDLAEINEKWQKYRMKEPEIMEYLRRFPALTAEVEQLRQYLADLGYTVPRVDYSTVGRPHQDKLTSTRPPALHADGVLGHGRVMGPDMSALFDMRSKRKRNDDDHGDLERLRNEGEQYSEFQAHLMPPPRFPASRSPQRSALTSVQDHRLQSTNLPPQTLLAGALPPEIWQGSTARKLDHRDLAGTNAQIRGPISLIPTNDAHRQVPPDNLGMYQAHRTAAPTPQKPNLQDYMYQTPRQLRDRDNLEVQPLSSQAFNGQTLPETRLTGHQMHSQETARGMRAAGPTIRGMIPPSTPSPPKHQTISRSSQMSVASPFFRSSKRICGPSPSQYTGAGQSRRQLSSKGNRHHDSPFAIRGENQSHVHQKTSHGLSFLYEPRINTHQNAIGTSQCHMPYQQPSSTTTMQTPRNSQGLFTRYDVPDSVMHAPVSRMSAQYGPSSHRAAPLPSLYPSTDHAMNNIPRHGPGTEPALSHIRGLKSSAATPTQDSGQRHSAAYGQVPQSAMSSGMRRRAMR